MSAAQGAKSMAGIQAAGIFSASVDLRASSTGKQAQPQSGSWVGFTNMDDVNEAARAMWSGEAPSKRFSADVIAQFKQQFDDEQQAIANGGAYGLLDYLNKLPEEALDTISPNAPPGWTHRQQRDLLEMQKYLVDDVMGGFRKEGRVVDGGGKQTDPEVIKVLDILKGISEASNTPAQHSEAMRKAHEYVQSKKPQTSKQPQDIVTLSAQARQMLAATR
jgi:hypothetical protein